MKFQKVKNKLQNPTNGYSSSCAQDSVNLRLDLWGKRFWTIEINRVVICVFDVSDQNLFGQLKNPRKNLNFKSTTESTSAFSHFITSTNTTKDWSAFCANPVFLNKWKWGQCSEKVQRPFFTFICKITFLRYLMNKQYIDVGGVYPFL